MQCGVLQAGQSLLDKDSECGHLEESLPIHLFTYVSAQGLTLAKKYAITYEYGPRRPCMNDLKVLLPSSTRRIDDAPSHVLAIESPL